MKDKFKDIAFETVIKIIGYACLYIFIAFVSSTGLKEMFDSFVSSTSVSIWGYLTGKMAVTRGTQLLILIILLGVAILSFIQLRIGNRNIKRISDFETKFDKLTKSVNDLLVENNQLLKENSNMTIQINMLQDSLNSSIYPDNGTLDKFKRGGRVLSKLTTRSPMTIRQINPTKKTVICWNGHVLIEFNITELYTPDETEEIIQRQKRL